jgi:hypothetical protein
MHKCMQLCGKRIWYSHAHSSATKRNSATRGLIAAAAAAAAAVQVLDSDQSMEVAGLAALALGLVFTSSCKEDVVEALLTALMSRWATVSEPPHVDAYPLVFAICMAAAQPSWRAPCIAHGSTRRILRQFECVIVCSSVLLSLLWRRTWWRRCSQHS